MSKKMSITDIAKIAGVSVSTVSRSLQDSPLISTKTKELVQSIALEHNFKINTRARNLRTQKSNVVGLLCNMNHDEKQETSDQFLFSLVNSISASLHEHNHDLLLHTSPSVTAELASSYVFNQKVDGLIIFGQGKNQHKEIIKLSEMNVPFVVWGGYVDEAYTTVGSDNFQGGLLATRKLIERGCKKIIFLGPWEHDEIHYRYQGYRQALQEANLTPPVEKMKQLAFCIESGFEATQHLVESDTEFDGFVCASDTIALGAVKCLRRNKIKVPDKVAVMGFDDISFAKDWSPKLSTVHQDTLLGGKLLVEKVLDKIKGKEVKSSQMDIEIVLRESA